MFVTEGALQKIQTKRRERFVDEYIMVLLEEAKKLGIEKNDVVTMIENIK